MAISSLAKNPWVSLRSEDLPAVEGGHVTSLDDEAVRPDTNAFFYG